MALNWPDFLILPSLNTSLTIVNVSDSIDLIGTLYVAMCGLLMDVHSMVRSIYSQVVYHVHLSVLQESNLGVAMKEICFLRCSVSLKK